MVILINMSDFQAWSISTETNLLHSLYFTIVAILSQNLKTFDVFSLMLNSLLYCHVSSQEQTKDHEIPDLAIIPMWAREIVERVKHLSFTWQTPRFDFWHPSGLWTLPRVIPSWAARNKSRTLLYVSPK